MSLVGRTREYRLLIKFFRCHVMERESFESEAVAKVMNEHFINIKVDREERPDVDKVYMTFVQVPRFLCWCLNN